MPVVAASKTQRRPEQLQIVLNRLPKPDPGIEYNLLPAHYAIAHSPQALFKELPDLAHHVNISRISLHSLGIALRVHAHVAGTRLGDKLPQRAFRPIGEIGIAHV